MPRLATLVLLVSLCVACERTSPTPGAPSSPTSAAFSPAAAPSSSAAASATVVAAPTIGAPTPTVPPAPTPPVATGMTRYSNTELGYTLDLPAGWRLAACSPGLLTTSPLSAAEMFVSVPESEEVIAAGTNMVIVGVNDAKGSTPVVWLEQHASQPDVQVEPATVGGKPGARAFIVPMGTTYAFAVAARGWMYDIGQPFFGYAEPDGARILPTLRLLDDATLGRAPKPSPVPRTIESLVDSISDGLARKDLAAIADAIAPCVTAGGVPGDPALYGRANYVKVLKEEFAAGATIRVVSRSIETDPYAGRFVRSIWSKPGGPDQRLDLHLRVDGARWSVGAFIFRAPGS